MCVQVGTQYLFLAPKPNFLLPTQDFSQDSCHFVTIPGIILLGGLNP